MTKTPLKKWLLKNWFIIGLIVAITISIIEPGIGYSIGFDGVTTDILIIIIFFITGIMLPSETILSKLSNVKFHVFTQAFIFIFIPLYVALTAGGGLILWGKKP